MLIALVCVSCQLEDNTLNVKRIGSIYPESLSLSALGEVRNIEVNIDDFWTVHIDEDDVDWISVDRQSGSGADIICLSSLRQEKGYSTEIRIVSDAGIFTVPIVVDEAYYLKDGFDMKRSSVVFPFPQIGYFSGWDRFGIGAQSVTYLGNNAYVTGLFGSFGYNGASGLNNIWFEEEGSLFDVMDIDVSLSEDKLFSVRFNARCISSEGDSRDFDSSDLRLSVSSNNNDYIPLTYSFSGDEWKSCSASFSISHTDKVSLRFVAAKGGVYLDDIMLMVAEESPQEGDFMVRTGDAGNVSKTAAELNGSFVHTGSGTITNIGFEYRKSDDMSEIISIPVEDIEAVFNVKISDLQEGESYVYRAYAETSSLFST